MAEDVQRALDNLRFDRMVKAFCTISPDNEIFQSTLDSTTEAMVKQTVSLYQGQISQLTVNTEAGLVVISKISNNWLLAVLFPPNLSLGIAVVKTKATLLALRELDLNILKAMPPPSAKPSPPPQPIAPTPAPPPTPTPSPEPPNATPPSPPVVPITQPVEPLPPPEPSPAIPEEEPLPPPEPSPAIPEEEPLPPPMEPPPVETLEPPPPTPSEKKIDLTFIPEGGQDLLAALDKGSPVGGALYEKFGPHARDVLFLVDGTRDVKTIAFLLGLPEYAIVEVLEFAISNKILAKPV